MGDANTRTLLIKGSAAEQYMKVKGRRGGRGGRGTRKMERDEEGALVQRGGDSERAERRALGNTHVVQSGGDAPPGAPITNAKNYNAAARLVKNAGPVMIQKGGDSERAQRKTLDDARPVQRGGDPPVASTPGHQPQDMTKTVGQSGSESPAMRAQLNAGTNPPTVVSQGGLQTSGATGQGGGGKKVVLAPKKKSRSKVVLTAGQGQGHAAGKKKPAPLTQTRKIRVGLSSLKKRLTRARGISKDSKEKSINEIRKVLEEAKLVKPAAEGKKVPESVLRDIYKDYLLLRSKAL